MTRELCTIGWESAEQVYTDTMIDHTVYVIFDENEALSDYWFEVCLEEDGIEDDDPLWNYE